MKTRMLIILLMVGFLCIPAQLGHSLLAEQTLKIRF